ncbi:fidgetin-like protein 1 isoform X2 [Physella acuta]|uniref:fidgetin-like protein 1 isoform X2 n=1 Tax=Physella acuta TaxID=109671 RepID=UPI0027DCC828|nr:fidgetin-like protein 1 isoform X2 [Physella acuta]
MNLKENESGFITCLQQLLFASSTLSQPSELADVYRNMYLHMQRASTLEKSKQDQDFGSDFQKEAATYLKKYTSIVDNINTGGLNNYAEGALALCSKFKNESAKWKTSSVNKMMEKLCSQHLSEDEDSVIQLQCLKPKSSSCTETECSINQKPTFRFQKIVSKHSAINAPNQEIPVINEPSPGPRPVHNNVCPSSKMLYQTVIQDKQPARPQSAFSYSSVKEPPGYMNTTRYPQPSPTYTAQGNITPSVPKIVAHSSNYGEKRKKSHWSYNQAADNDQQEEEDQVSARVPFKTAKQQLVINQLKTGGYVSEENYGAVKKSLGTRRGPTSKFIPPILNRDSDEQGSCFGQSAKQTRDSDQTNSGDEFVDEKLKGIDPKMIELIKNEIMDHGALITWSDIAGLEFAKKTIKEIVVWPMLRPDIFVGLRGPPKGLLLFGPPGTGKTLIGKCIASQSKSTFFSISASSLTSKWVGEGEKMVRALFAVARFYQPAVVFIDEIDSLLSQRSDSEHESSRRIKTEFLVQLDGAATQAEDRILVIGATNRPQELDEAARRRFVKRLLIPLPEAVARQQIVLNLMSQQNSQLSEKDIQAICDKTDGYSGADMTNLCREAALGPIRSIPIEEMETITPDQVRPILFRDFEEALCQVRASVSPKDLELYTEWSKTFGSFGH